MKKRLLFIINPKAGKTAVKNELFDIIMIFSNAGYEVVMHPTTGPEDAENTVIAEGANYDLIVCAGGDGTIDNTVRGYMKMEKKVPIGYIPVGTTNDFARSLQISRKPSDAAKQIVQGNSTWMDVGTLNDKHFIYIAAFGVFTDISYNTKQSLKKVIGHSAYVLEAIRNLGKIKSYEIEAVLDGVNISGKYIYGMVTNSSSVAGFKLRGAKHVALDDGKFDCLFVKTPKNVSEVQQILSAIISNEMDGNEMFFRCKASKVTVKSKEEIPWTVDGEYGGSYTEVSVMNHKKAVEMYIGDSYGIEGITEGDILDTYWTEPFDAYMKELEAGEDKE